VVFMGWLDGSELKSDDWDEMARPTSVTFANAKGFKYFSSQSNWTPDQTLAVRRSGLSVRFAYFSGFCPQDAQNKVEGGDKRYCPDQRHQDKRAFTPAFPQLTLRMRTDCCVISRDAELTSTSNNEQGLRGGRVFAPSQWGDYSMRRSVVEREYAAIKKKP
ncbi:MAG: hypothetical protein ABL907_09200, partial [Hyphomicrobium sp.]